MRWRNALFVITRKREYRLSNSHKKFPGEIFNVACDGPQGGCQGWHAIKNASTQAGVQYMFQQ
ncbi:hypothetical protein EXT68_00510 [Pectobacterium parmentieri]|uniref:Uncharacterized protein n=1 Tax=Pectobacterium parmentieri TaxID=1905730 RepID=A0ABS0RZI0_PECPM|nr:hypothetical protein [Pectobacterium parmentieri]MBI0471329.1 hypothetical protein [Pectobacterium parmentieri]MBI0493941.1 hypothetical protein [Pectobacterium parmentieri]MBI0555052.1 hypothetical protein [Pectobacterium parmentieri]MBI0568249.1 hypothetical protein [Pectobacterium parmentieri]MBI0573218.1 hypothetical protein [Pectobacterium parmentieri]